MSPEATKKFSLAAACGASLAFALYDGWVVSLGGSLSEQMFQMHQFVVSVALATWLVIDVRARGRTSPSFDHGWFAIALLPVYAPYHLISTRKWRGLALGCGVIALFLLPWFVELLVGT